MNVLRACVVLSIVAASGCSHQTSNETAADSVVVKWSAEGVAAPKPFEAAVSSAKGTSYAVSASVGTLGGKQVPGLVVVKVKTNPTKAEISGACQNAQNYAGDPQDVLTTKCRILETLGKAGVTGQSTETVTSTISVKGDGKIAIAAE